MLKKIALSFLKTLAVSAFWITLWFVLAKYVVGMELLLPSPITVGKRLLEITSQKDFYVTTAYSLLRVSFGILIASLISIILSVITYSSRVANALVSPFITVIKATPVASFIILALLWLDRSELPVFIAILMLLPIMWTNLMTGLAQTDKKLIEMAKVFRVGRIKTLFGIYVPSVLPYFTSAAKTSLGLAWKAGIAAEVLAVPAKSIGKKLFDSKAYFETADLFAWTAVVILLSLIIEIIFEALISRILSKRRSRSNG